MLSYIYIFKINWGELFKKKIFGKNGFYRQLLIFLVLVDLIIYAPVDFF